MTIARKVEERIRKLQLIHQIVSDPELLSLLQEVLADADSKNGLALAPQEGEPEKSGPERAVESPKRGNLLRRVLDTANSMPGPFDVNAIEQRMVQSGFPFGAKSPKIAVGSALRKLERRNMIRILTRGSGSAPNIYRRLTE